MLIWFKANNSWSRIASYEFFQNTFTEIGKKVESGSILQGLVAVLFATDFENMLFLDSGGKELFIKNASAKSRNSTHPNKEEFNRMHATKIS